MYYGPHFRVKKLKHREYVTFSIARKSKRHNIPHVKQYTPCKKQLAGGGGGVFSKDKERFKMEPG